jgi:HNH endonuclease
MGRRKIDVPVLLCAHCDGEIERRRYVKRGGKRGIGTSQGINNRVRFCSKSCANKGRVKKIWLDKHGYPQATIDGHQMALHRHVMEKRLGRKLLPTETVHHKDGNRKNYAESNLELWASRHGRGQRVSDLPVHHADSAFVNGLLGLAA